MKKIVFSILIVFILLSGCGKSNVPFVPSFTEKIAFISNRDGNNEIYTMNTDGTEQTRITNTTYQEFNAKISPDGLKIAYVYQKDGGKHQIFTMNIDGTGEKQLTTDNYNTYPAWSPDGTKIVFASYRDANWEIYVMNYDGSNQTRLTNDPAIDDRPSFSHDGTKIAFSSTRSGGWKIITMNADGSNPFNTNVPGVSPEWSPDGTKIACHNMIISNTKYEIFVFNVDGTNKKQLTDTGKNLTPYWSPDGTKIAFKSNRSGGTYEIYIMDADGNNVKRITNNTSLEDYISWAKSIDNLKGAANKQKKKKVQNNG